MRPSIQAWSGDQGMTRKGAQVVIDSIDQRLDEIEAIEDRLRAEKCIMLVRREELVARQECIEPTVTIVIG